MKNYQKEFIAACRKHGVTGNTITREQLLAVCTKEGYKCPPAWLVQDQSRRAGRGSYWLDMPRESAAVAVSVAVPATVAQAVASAPATIRKVSDVDGCIPKKSPTYVPWGHFTDVRSIIAKRIWFPVYITGMSGNGKTTMVEQACADAGREYFRVNITAETDEDDLLGGFRLVNGETVWQDGPVVQAMKRGAILLLDEVDLGTDKTMCLQPIMDGKPVFLKKISQWVEPAQGFNVFATANTKGKGSEDGRFIGTRHQNEAALDRYSITLEQDYASPATERKILVRAMASLGIDDVVFADKLTQWADTVRKSFAAGAADEVISTRRLVDICKAYAIFGDRMKAINLCVSRFDEKTKGDFLNLYEKIDEQVTAEAQRSGETEVVRGG
jgi:MoxR-like ATPase